MAKARPRGTHDIIVRDATRADLSAVVALLAGDSLGKSRERVDASPTAGYVAAFEAIDADPNNRLLVIERQGFDGPIGTLQLTLIPGISHQGSTRAQIEAVRIASDHQGLGIGEQVFRWAIEEARSKGCRMVQLTSDLRRADAKRFYERIGFVHSHAGMKLILEAPSDE